MWMVKQNTSWELSRGALGWTRQKKAEGDKKEEGIEWISAREIAAVHVGAAENLFSFKISYLN